MADTNHRVDVIIKILTNRIETRVLVYDGWPNKRHVKDLRVARGLSEDFDVPEVSITEYDHWPNHLDVNVWAKSPLERDEVSHRVIDILNQIKKEPEIGIRDVRAQDITFEEKGIIRPGKWDIVKKSKPIFRKLIQVGLS